MSWLDRHRIDRMADPADGTLKVTASTYPPTNVSAVYASVRITGVVQAPGLLPAAVEHAGTAPVARWPQPGADLPVTVDRSRPSQLVIHWDQVPSARATALADAEAEAAQLRTGLDPAVVAEAIEQTAPGRVPTWSAPLAAQLPAAGSAAAQAPPPSAPAPPPEAEPPSMATVPVTGRVLAVDDVAVPAAFAPAGGVADLTVAVPGDAGGPGHTVICRAAFSSPAQRDKVAVPGATAQFLIDPANPSIISLPAPGEQQPDKSDE